MRVYVGLIMLRRVLSPDFLASFWLAGFGTFFLVLAFAPIGWRIALILRQRRRKRQIQPNHS